MPNRRTLSRLAVVLILSLPACAQMGDILGGMEKPTLTIEAVRLKDLSLTDLSLEFDIGIKNPYSAAIPVTKAAFALASGGKNFLSGVSDRQGLIGAGKTEIYPIVAKVPFAGLLGALSGVKPGAVIPWNAKIDLSVDTPVLGTISIPIEKSGDLPIPTVPRISLARFEVASMSLTEVSAVLNLDVGNTNSFPLDLVAGQFGVSLAGVEVGGARLDGKTTLAANGNAGLRIPIRFSPRALGAAGLSALTNRDLTYRLAGNLAGGTQWGPIDLPFTAQGQAPIAR